MRRRPGRADRARVAYDGKDSLARAVVKAPKYTHTTPILKSIRWLKTNERIEYKVLYLTFKLLYSKQPVFSFSAFNFFLI